MGIVGASIGGLVSAAALADRRINVTLFERGRSVTGLYNKVDTPFGRQELGMHVIYVNQAQYAYLCEIFGADVFELLEGVNVDIGASHIFGRSNFDSVYPDVRHHRDLEQILVEMRAGNGGKDHAANARDEAIRRFGRTAALDVTIPTLEKLWHAKAETLTEQALHCFYDLRRLVVCGKAEADVLKQDAWLDQVVANPVQTEPFGKIYGDRVGLVFKAGHTDLNERALAWAERHNVRIELETQISIDEGRVLSDGVALSDTCDACIVAAPIHTLAPHLIDELDQIELSIAYFQLDRRIGADFPAYYLLCHDPALKSSRIVNYEAYNPDRRDTEQSVLSVEFLHPVGKPPETAEIGDEISRIFPNCAVAASHRLERSMKLCSPTLANKTILDKFEQEMSSSFGKKPIYFSGMRTDTGQFFSHNTIGSAYASALDCYERLR
ncbi:NAD(P)-binding protein [Hoeflea ulvae]|uniref:NAD(P)-binding protein n=1 Tax=Hoeflea ulvae TaxID=2983764 RepID=A0ABT3YCK1_9HYPH|nr:NAD(P)-binding protein [Hoeflea ulvae]MCY0093620.1 NAD(P)-binding protein [Hoeflea ulvae]